MWRAIGSHATWSASWARRRFASPIRLRISSRSGASRRRMVASTECVWAARIWGSCTIGEGSSSGVASGNPPCVASGRRAAPAARSGDRARRHHSPTSPTDRALPRSRTPSARGRSLPPSIRPSTVPTALAVIAGGRVRRVDARVVVVELLAAHVAGVAGGELDLGLTHEVVGPRAEGLGEPVEPQRGRGSYAFLGAAGASNA
jgi:hypothetical protein